MNVEEIHSASGSYAQTVVFFKGSFMSEVHTHCFSKALPTMVSGYFLAQVQYRHISSIPKERMLIYY